MPQSSFWNAAGRGVAGERRNGPGGAQFAHREDGNQPGTVPASTGGALSGDQRERANGALFMGGVALVKEILREHWGNYSANG